MVDTSGIHCLKAFDVNQALTDFLLCMLDSVSIA